MNNSIFSQSNDCDNLLHYFQKYNYFTELSEIAENFVFRLEKCYEKNVFSVCRYVLYIDLIDLLDKAAEEATRVIAEPRAFEWYCADLLHACARELCKNKDVSVQRAQFDVSVRFTTFPVCVLENYSGKSNNGIISCRGIVVSLSKPCNYIIHSVWLCPEECPESEVIFKYLPKNSPKCQVCRSKLFEDTNWRVCGDKVTASVKTDKYDMCQSVTVKDDLITKLSIGQEYLFVCTVENKTMSAFYVDKCVTLADKSVKKRIPRNIMKLFDKCAGVPWKFIYSLASSIASDFCPCDVLMHLKICLLMSLVSVQHNANSNAGGLLHLLIATADTSYVPRIMEDAVELGTRYSVVGLSDCSLSESLLANYDGVTVLPFPYHIYKDKTMLRIINILEKGVVMHEENEVPLNCAIWCQGADTKKALIINVASVFGFVCVGDLGESNDQLIERILDAEPSDERERALVKKARSDLKFYIQMARAIKVKLEPKAERLITNFFMAVRENASEIVKVRAISTLISLSVCSARLCMRTVCNTDDVLLAIWLHIYGSPKPRCAPHELMETPSNMAELHEMMEAFKVWLHDFIQRTLSN